MGDNDRRPISGEISAAQQITAGLGRGIWTIRRKRKVLFETPRLNTAKHLIRGNLHQFFQIKFSHRFEQIINAKNICLQKRGRVHYGTIHMGFSRVIDYYIYIIVLNRLSHRRCVANISFYKFIFKIALYFL